MEPTRASMSPKDEEIRACICYPLDGGPHFCATAKEFFVISKHVGHCDVIILVWRDFSRVFLAGGEFGYDWIARELDAVAIDALAERFKLETLRKVVACRSNPS